MKIKFLFLFLIPLFSNSVLACVQTGSSVDAGTLNPTAAAQTIGVTAGEYFSFTLNECESVVFSFCNDGGSAGFDTQISILDNSGSVELDYNDDFCGTRSELSFSATSSGTFKVLITQYSCNHTSGATGTLSYKKLSPTIVDDYVLNQDSNPITVGGENCVELTQELNSQLGCVWNQNPLDFSNPVEIDATYYFGDNGANGADGNTIVFKSSNSMCDCGIGGHGMGAQGLPNTVIVEFDSFDNDGADLSDISSDHIAIEIDGVLVQNTGDPMPFAGPVEAIPGGADIDDGAQHSVKVTWDPATQEMQVFFDGVLRLTTTHDFINNVFGGNTSITWGVTSATGGFNNQQYFCPSTVTILPVELISFNSNCQNGQSVLNWEVASEDNVKEYRIQKTTNGISFETIGVVEAKGSNSVYQFQALSSNQTSYFRIKSIDFDGVESVSEIIASSCFQEVPEVNVFNLENSLQIQVFGAENKNIIAQLISLDGKILSKKNLIADNGFLTFDIDKNQYDSKVIILQLVGLFAEKNYHKKIYIMN